jgi:ribosomal protein L37E
MSNLVKLNPCAACGSKRYAIMTTRCPETGWQVFIDCQECGGAAYGLSVRDLTEALERAATNWNDRDEVAA